MASLDVKPLNKFLLSSAFPLAGSDSTLTHSGSLPGDFLHHSSAEPSPLLTQFNWNFSAADDTLDLALDTEYEWPPFEGQRSFSYPTGDLCSKSLFPSLLLNAAREMRRIVKTEEKNLAVDSSRITSDYLPPGVSASTGGSWCRSSSLCKSLKGQGRGHT